MSMSASVHGSFASLSSHTHHSLQPPSLSSHSQHQCLYCPNPSPNFKSYSQFYDHLRVFHATKEGGSFVCRYGPHNICKTLPLEGVSDVDYEKHVRRDHGSNTSDMGSIRSISSVPSTSSEPNLAGFYTTASAHQPYIVMDSATNKWTVYNSSVNLPAVLNDPGKSRVDASVFLTRHWGEGFVDRCDIPPSPYLPNITSAHFQHYLARHYKRVRRHERDLRKTQLKERQESADQKGVQHDGDGEESWRDVLHLVPRMFLDSGFNLTSTSIFASLFLSPDIISSVAENQLQGNSDIGINQSLALRKSNLPELVPESELSHQSRVNHGVDGDGGVDDPLNDVSNPFSDVSIHSLDHDEIASMPKLQRNKLLEEKLTHYLDLIEVQIIRQIHGRSAAFFHAMTSHDELQYYLAYTKAAVQQLRSKVKLLDKNLVAHSMRMLAVERQRANAEMVQTKVKLMATVRESQTSVQMLLNSYDFLGALELISATQEVLQQDLAGITSFRHLSSQLAELEKMINKMLQDEFVRYVQLELVRPAAVDDDPSFGVDTNQLTSLILGLLKLQEYRFVEVLKEEISVAARNLIKETIREVIEESEAASPAAAESGNISSLADQMRQLSFDEWISLFKLVLKNLLLMSRKVKVIEERLIELIDYISGVKPTPSARDMIQSPVLLHDDFDAPSVPSSDYAKLKRDISEVTDHACSYTQERAVRVVVARSKGGFMERISARDFLMLSEAVEQFVSECETLCGRRLTPLRGSVQAQAAKFVNRFHEDKKDKLALILDSEHWRQAEVPERFQNLVDCISRTSTMGHHSTSPVEVSKPKKWLMVNGEKFAVVGTSLLFLEMIVDYCQCVADIPCIATELHTRLIELLKHFNSRACQLVLGAGAVQLVGLKTISTRNLALASRCLQLIIAYIPLVQRHFEKYLGDGQVHLSKHFNSVLKDYQDHVSEIFNKLLAIMDHHLSSALSKWELSPPSPTNSFQLICKQMKKLHETINDVLPSDQVQKLFLRIHDCFKGQLRTELSRLGISTNSGTQYGFVCTEFSYYMESIRALPCCASVSESLTEVLLQK